jgi:hypothetical protein
MLNKKTKLTKKTIVATGKFILKSMITISPTKLFLNRKSLQSQNKVKTYAIFAAENIGQNRKRFYH